MIYPSVEELSKNGHNRYVLCIAAAKCARKITDETAATIVLDAKDDKTPVRRVVSEEKPVNTAIKQMHRHCFDIIMPEEDDQNN